MTTQEVFKQKGYTVVKGLLNQDEVDFYKKELDKLAVGRKKKWTWGDGVSQNEPFWNVIVHPKIREAVTGLLGSSIKYLQHNDLHVGFSSFGWHRDSMNREFGVGPDWDESTEPYQNVRVGIYMQDASSGFKLGMVPGSHRPDKYLDDKAHERVKKGLSNVNNIVSKLTKKNTLEGLSDWIRTEPGDAVIFDPRVVHTGGEFSGKKYSMFVAYGVPNQHFFNHYHYYRHLRKDLPYKAFAPKLVELLKKHDLYASEAPPEHDGIEGAWIPSSAFTYIAKQFK